MLTIGLAAFDILPTLPGRADMEVPDGSGNFTMFKVLRTLRLIKLMRLARAERVFSRWESKITLTYGTQTILRCFFMLLISAHWYACIFALQATMVRSAAPLDRSAAPRPPHRRAAA